METFKVVYYNRNKQTKVVEKVCFLVNGKKKYIYRINGLLRTKDGNLNYFFSSDTKSVVHYPGSTKKVKSIMHRLGYFIN